MGIKYEDVPDVPERLTLTGPTEIVYHVSPDVDDGKYVRRGRPATGAKSAAERKRAERARKKEKGDG